MSTTVPGVVGNPVWQDAVPPADFALFEVSGLGQRAGLGSRPALLVVDVTIAFTGDRPEPVGESIKRYPLSCGQAAWDALPRIRDLAAAARAQKIPVIYTHQAPRTNQLLAGEWARKNARILGDSEADAQAADGFPDIIAPGPDDLVIAKDKPSAFFGTPLVSYLVALNVDCLIVAGATTSGCVRATVVDAFSYNYRQVVVGDCTFDRFQISHKIGLFDIHGKYADIMSLDDAVAAMNAVNAGPGRSNGA